MEISLVLSSRNRADRLRTTLGWLEPESFRRTCAELVLVDSASEDHTWGVMTAFAADAGFPVLTVRAGQHRPVRDAAARPSRTPLPGVSA